MKWKEVATEANDHTTIVILNESHYVWLDYRIMLNIFFSLCIYRRCSRDDFVECPGYNYFRRGRSISEPRCAGN